MRIITGIYGIISQDKLRKAINLESFIYSGIVGNKNKCAVDSQNFSNAILGRCSLNKFNKEKIFQYISDYLICIDGIILNQRLLFKATQTKNLQELVLQLYKEQDYNFPKKLRGSFVGFIYSKNEEKLLLFTDHIASRPIFYFYDENHCILLFGSDLKTLVDILHKIGYVPHLDMQAAYCLLTFGHMLGDLTLVKEIRKVPPGSIITYTNDEFAIKQYYRLSSQPFVSDNEGVILYELAKRFKMAVFEEYTKDLEYGYRHIATLSGGLDSRTNIAFAKNLGINNITCVTYSQSNYLDYKIAKKISHENGFNFIFFPLDDGNHLVKYMDEIISINGGLVSYLPISSSYPCIKKLELGEYGLLHTGLLGGEIFGEYAGCSHPRNYEQLRYFINGESSGNLLGKISHLIDKELSKYESTELFKFYNIGVNAQMMNIYVMNQFIDATSAHLYPDLLEYAIRMPEDYKNNKKIYTKMINTYLPEFAKYTWEHSRISPKYPLHLLKGYGFALSLFNYGVSKLSPQYSMNPFGYWYKKNDALRKSLTLTFKNSIDVLRDQKELKDDCEYLFKEGDFLEKTTAITLLRALKLLQINCQEDE